jgi:hypothetical protein
MPQSFADELRSIPVSPGLGESLQRAYGFARDQSLPAVTLEHLLLALTEDPESAPLLEAGNVDMARLSADASSYLGRLMENGRIEPGAEPRADPELLRVLQAAASATKKSPRRFIDGSIVLAAVVGDGKSPAAGLLKAHGLTFEHAIRALQQANARARTRQFSTTQQARVAQVQAPTPAPPPPAAEPKPVERPVAEPPADPSAGRFVTEAPVAGAGPQSAEDILAAARARIQQRAVSSAERSEAPHPLKPEEDHKPSQPPPGYAAPPPPAADPGLQVPPQAPPQAQPAAPVPVAGPSAPPTEPRAQRPAEAPVAAPAPVPPRPQRQPEPTGRLFGRPVRPGEGPPRPPLPPSPGGGGRLTARLERVPGPGGGPGPVPTHSGPHPTVNGHLPGGFPAHAGTHPRVPPPAGAAPPPGRQPQAAQQTQAGPIIESVPRRMRAGVASAGEVRIARDRVEGLIAALNGAAARPDSFAVRALSVRLRAPNGGFTIEPTSPETQWVENTSSLIHDDHAVWRWIVTPQRSGNGRLVIMVSARTIGHDGVAADTAPPDRVIDIKVRGNPLRRVGRAAAWVVVAALGAAAARFGPQLWDAGAQAVRMVAGW